MKIKVEIECSPEEFKELFVPSDKQAEFTARAYQAMVEAAQRVFVDQFNVFKKD
ncbi:MAG: hypothetical protein AAF667_06760 [Pseudomonadota bacterium]